jgi:hypothetical protein
MYSIFSATANPKNINESFLFLSFKIKLIAKNKLAVKKGFPENIVLINIGESKQTKNNKKKDFFLSILKKYIKSIVFNKNNENFM